MNSNVCGYAEFPITYRVGIINLMRLGRNMYLNQSLFRQFLTTDSQRKKLIAHEFGHMIGLRHTNWRTNEAEFDVASGQIVGAYLIPGTDNSSNNPDPLSVFNSANCGSNWNGFSSFDRIAIRHLTNNGTQM